MCDGEIIDYAMITNHILYRAKYLKIMGIGYDPYRSAEFINGLRTNLSNPDELFIPVTKTHGTSTSPVETFNSAN